MVGSHRRTVLSFEPEAIRSPAGETATECTASCTPELSVRSSCLDRMSCLVTSESESPKLWLEVPYHHARITGTTDQLLHVWIERHRCDCILHSGEKSFRHKQREAVTTLWPLKDLSTAGSTVLLLWGCDILFKFKVKAGESVCVFCGLDVRNLLHNGSGDSQFQGANLFDSCFDDA